MQKQILHRTLLALLIALWLLPMNVHRLLAQDDIIVAQVDRSTSGINETVTLTLTINRADAEQPQVPKLDGFLIASVSTSSQLSSVNGKASVQVIYQYVLQPTRKGELKIPPIRVMANGKLYTTKPITVKVVQKATSAQPSPTPSDLLSKTQVAAAQLDNQDFFVKQTVDQSTAYLGQQLTYIFRLYQSVELIEPPNYQAPDFTGFWHEQKNDQSQLVENISGRDYRVTELRTILFPTLSGEQTIGRASVTIADSPFQNGGVLQADPVTVTVKPLPPTPPTGFSGAVGQIFISATVSADTVKVNEPVNLRIVLQGSGNVAAWSDPVVPALQGWRKFDSTAKTDSRTQNGQLIGQRTYEQLLVPTEAGELGIPAVNYSYFDPQKGSYQTLTTKSFTVTVKAAAAELPVPAVINSTGGSGGSSQVSVLASDIRHIKPAPGAMVSASEPLTNSPLYWFMWGVPPLIIVVDWVLQLRRRRLANNPLLMRRMQAQKKAHQILVQARKQAVDPYPIVGQALTEYLSAKLNQPIVGLTQTALSEQLTRQGLDAVLVEQVNQLLMRSEIGRFAPQTNGTKTVGDNLLADTEQLIGSLEKVLSA